MTIALLLDAALVVLLMVTIAYCALVHRRLGVLRAAQDEMQEMIARFNQATQRAEAGISGLRAVGEEVNRQIDPKIEDTRVLRDDLQLLIERGEKAAERLEQGISLGRKAAENATGETGRDRKTSGGALTTPERHGARQPAVKDEAAPAAKGAPAPSGGRRSQREVELINALKTIGK